MAGTKNTNTQSLSFLVVKIFCKISFNLNWIPLPHWKWRAGYNPTWMSGSHLCIPRNETLQPPYFQNRIIMVCLPIPTLIYLWEIYIFLGSVCLFCCSQICGPILGIYKSLPDTWMWKLGLRPRKIPRKGINKWGFRCSTLLTTLAPLRPGACT